MNPVLALGLAAALLCVGACGDRELKKPSVQAAQAYVQAVRSGQVETWKSLLSPEVLSEVEAREAERKSQASAVQRPAVFPPNPDSVEGGAGAADPRFLLRSGAEAPWQPKGWREVSNDGERAVVEIDDIRGAIELRLQLVGDRWLVADGGMIPPQ